MNIIRIYDKVKFDFFRPTIIKTTWNDFTGHCDNTATSAQLPVLGSLLLVANSDQSK